MITVIDLAGCAAPMMVLLMTREMILRVFDMLSHVAGAVFSIATCLQPGLSPYLILLPISALGLWDTLIGPSGTRPSRKAGECPDTDRSLVVRRLSAITRWLPTVSQVLFRRRFENDRD